MKNRKSLSTIILIASVLFLTNCASSNTGSGLVDNTFKEDLGTVEDFGFDILVRRLESRHQYEIARRQDFGSGEAYVETYWKRTLPFGETLTKRNYEVETRITIRARPKSRSGVRLYNLSFVGEYRQQVTNDSTDVTSYKAVELPEVARDYFKEISTDLSDQVEGRIGGF
jgi:hypothetical protein